MTMETEDAPAPEAGPSTARECDQTLAESKSVDPNLSSQRVFKKSSPNCKLTMYLASRDLVASQGRIDVLTGVLLLDPEFVDNRKVYGQITLTFRYGREDEEVMGLKFCNEAVMCLTQLYPPPANQIITLTPLQEALLKRLGENAYPFTMEITPLAPPSVQLVPAKEYNGAPIGTSYDVRAYVAERIDEKMHKRTMVRMGIRVVQRAFAPPSPNCYVPGAGKTTKEQAKLNRKTLLFGCKSAPLDNRFFVTHALSKSAEVVPEAARLDDEMRRQEMKAGHSSMPECRRDETETPEAGDNQDVDMKSPERKSPIKQGGRVTFDAEREEDDDEDAEDENEEAQTEGGRRRQAIGTSADGESERRRPSLRTDSVESTDDRISDYYRSLCGAKRPSMAAYLAEVPNPRAVIEKPFLLSEGKVFLSASLDKGIYSHGEEIRVSVEIRNNSSKTIRRIKVFVVQHVDVCMFSNGKFKNVVALVCDKDSCPIVNGGTFNKTYTLLPLNSSTKNWIALEDTYTKSSSSLSSTVRPPTGTADDRNVFAIYVSYYVKVKLLVTVMGGDVSLKLPFTLMHTCTDYDGETLTRVKKIEPHYLQPPQTQYRRTELDIKPEKDGT